MSTQINAPAGAYQTPPVLPRAAGGKLGKDEFLKLLVAQMSNQDPMNPTDGTQLAVQLAQFSSVEQLIQLNDRLGEQADGQSAILQSINGTAALGTLGHTVLAFGNQVSLTPGGTPGVTVQVGAGGGSGTLKLMDAAGRVVGTQTVGPLSGGLRSILLESPLRDLPAGTYTYQLELKGAQGEVVEVQPLMSGRVDGIRYTTEGPVLTAGGMTIPLRSVLQILADR